MCRRGHDLSVDGIFPLTGRLADDANDPGGRNSLPVIFYDLMRALGAITCDISFPQQRFWSGSWPQCHLDLYLEVGKRGAACKVFVCDSDYLFIYLFFRLTAVNICITLQIDCNK